MAVVVIASIVPTAGNYHAVETCLRDLAVLVRDEEGCLLYALHDTGEAVVVVEKWDSLQTLEAHTDGPLVRRMQAELDGRLGAPVAVMTCHPLGVDDSSKAAI